MKKYFFHFFVPSVALAFLISCSYVKDDRSQFNAGAQVKKTDKDLVNSGIERRRISEEPLEGMIVIVDPNKVSNLTPSLFVEWLNPVDVEDIEGYELVVQKSGQQVGTFPVLTVSDQLIDGKVVFSGHVELDLAEGRDYSFQIHGIKQNQKYHSTVGELTVDKTPPTLRLYLAMNRVDDACQNVPNEIRMFVSSRLIPYNFCAQDLGSVQTGIDKVCIRPTKNDPGQPDKDDACWKDPKETPELLMLFEGKNPINGYVRDRAGNTSKGSSEISLNISQPPEVNLIGPDAITLSKAWAPGESYDLEWEIKDDDTQYSTADEQIKIIISLINNKDRSDFQHLACNFSNSELWNQCPSETIQNSPLIKVISATGNEGKGKFTFQVPEGWDNDKSYLLTLTAIDKSGNGNVAGTQILNAGYEVLAGTTYQDLGSSGVVTQRIGGASPKIAFDKNAQLFNTTENFKINAFDYRTCRTIKPPNGLETAFDCKDILESRWAFDGGNYSLKNHWVYNGDQDVFYTVGSNSGQEYILRIDFNAQKIEPILGGAEKEILSDELPPTAKSTDFRPSKLSKYLHYSEIHNALFFMADGQLYSVQSDHKIDYILGKKGGSICKKEAPMNSTGDHDPEICPVPFENQPQRDVILPVRGFNHFTITQDLRMIIGGAHSISAGGSHGYQYVLEGISLENPSHPINFLKLEDIHYLASPLNYDPKRNVVFSSRSWQSLSYLNLDGDRQYQWTHLIEPYQDQENRNKNVSESLFLKNPQSTLPYRITVQVREMILAGEDMLYFSSHSTGSILSLNLQNNALEKVVGVDMENQKNGQLGINRRLDTPRFIQVTANDQIYVNDYYGLHRVDLPNHVNQQKPTISTILNTSQNRGFAQHLFKVFPDENKIYFENDGTLAIYDQTTGTHEGIRPQNYVGGYHYLGSLGFGNLSQNPVYAKFTSTWNLHIPDIDRSYLYLADFGSLDTLFSAPETNFKVLTAPDMYNLQYCNEGHTGPCPQSNAVYSNQQGGEYFKSEDFRLEKYMSNSRFGWRGYASTLAFYESDQKILACINNQYASIDLVQGRIYLIQHLRGGDETFSNCHPTRDHFIYFKGSVYLIKNSNKKVYQLDTSRIESENKLEGTEILFKRPLANTQFGGAAMSDQYLYYTDRDNHLLYRSAIQN